MEKMMTEQQFTALLAAVLLHEMRGEVTEMQKASIGFAVDRAEAIQAEVHKRARTAAAGVADE